MSGEGHDGQNGASSSLSSLVERRFKLSRACDRCRRRRIKCDEGHPCQACINAKSACTFEEPSKRHSHKSKRATTLEDRMQHLESLISAIPPAVFAAIPGGLPSAPSAPSNNNQTQQQQQSEPISITSPMLPLMSPIPPPPSLANFPLINPGSHFATTEMIRHPPTTTTISGYSLFSLGEPSRSSSYLYFDDEGYTRWQGETSGLPLLDLLVERHANPPATGDPVQAANIPPAAPDWFPDRTLNRPDFNPQTMWRIITSQIPPDLMDSLVQCYLSTSYYILPFLHIPTFLADYGNPQKWGEPGFASFIVAICCLASRHVEDPRVRKDPNDGISSGTTFFGLLDRLRTLPLADRPTLYTIQADLIAAVYAVGLGKLTKAASLLSEAVAISIDAGLHRSADSYDLFDKVEEEVRKRTFWCVYIWDKQLAAHFGRPCLMRYRDCDVGEPSMVDDEFITKEGILPGVPPPASSPSANGSGHGPGKGPESRMGSFVMTLRIAVVLESVLDVPPAPRSFADPSEAFLARAATLFRPPKPQPGDLFAQEEALLNEIHASIPPHWSHANPETTSSEDVVRVTQAGRLHCVEQFVRLLIYRYRFSAFVGDRIEGKFNPASASPTSAGAGAGGGAQLEMLSAQAEEKEREAMINAYRCAVEIVDSQVAIARKGLMTYYGVHVIHQLTQAGRTLVAVLLNCNSPQLEHLIPNGLETVKNCVGLLRRFSGRYVCGLRSGDLMEEFCRLTHIPLENVPRDGLVERSRPAWIRPVRKKASSQSATRSGNSNPSDSPSPPGGSQQHASPDAAGFDPSMASLMDLDGGAGAMYNPNADIMAFFGGSGGAAGGGSQGEMDVNQFFNGDFMAGLAGGAGNVQGLGGLDVPLNPPSSNDSFGL